MSDWLFDRPVVLLVLAFMVVGGLCFAAVAIDSAYREAHRDEWVESCRARCVRLRAESWGYDHRNGCSCGGAVRP
jgi:hypothetical protein